MPRDSDPHYALRDHIAVTLKAVLNRPRFKMKAEAREGWDLLITRDDRKYHLTIGIRSSLADIKVIQVDPWESHGLNSFYYHNSFEMNKMPNLRKIGVTIANKIIHAPIHEVMNA